jgi:hypothetical protein
MAGGGFTPPMGERFAQRQLMHQGFLHSTVPGRTDKLPISVKGGAYVLPADHVAALGQGNSLAGADMVNKMFKMGPYGTSPMGLKGTGARVPHLNLKAPMPHADGGSVSDMDRAKNWLRGMKILSAGTWSGKTAEDRAREETQDMADDIRSPRPPISYAQGGHEHGGKPTPIIAAGGEIVIPPEKIAEKFGDVDHGHKVLDKWVIETRKHHIKTLRKLKPPRKD